MAIQSVIELLRLDPQKFHSFYYNQSTIQPENEEPALVEAERHYEKMIENITNKVVTDLSDSISSIPSFTQNLNRQNRIRMICEPLRRKSVLCGILKTEK